MKDVIIDFLAAIFIFVMFFFLINMVFSAIAEGGELSIHLDRGIVEDSKICFQDAVEKPGPPSLPVCQYGYESIEIPEYIDHNIFVYIKTEVEKVVLSDAIMILQVLSGVK